MSDNEMLKFSEIYIEKHKLYSTKKVTDITVVDIGYTVYQTDIQPKIFSLDFDWLYESLLCSVDNLSYEKYPRLLQYPSLSLNDSVYFHLMFN